MDIVTVNDMNSQLGQSIPHSVAEGALPTAGRTNDPNADAFLFLLWNDVRAVCATVHDDPLEWMTFAHYVYSTTGHRIWTLAALFYKVGGTASRRRAAITNLLLHPFHPIVLQEVFKICEELDQGNGPLADLKPPVDYRTHVQNRMESLYVFQRKPEKDHSP